MISNIARTFILFSLCFMATNAWAIEFTMPLACNYGRDCFIQNYVDDAASGHSDYQCRHLTYDGHKGTDIRLRDFAAMTRGVKVLVATDGHVLRTRNDAPDTGLEAGPTALHERECGNGVVIAHADGFETQYCHLKQGSIMVRAGDAVKAGDVIGQVGYSGMTEFPHVHFQVMHNGTVVDPFNATTPATQARCKGDHLSLWQDTPPYIATAVLSAGFADTPPQKDNINAPLIPAATIARTTSSLIFYATLMGLDAGDVLTLRITAPDGSVMISHPTRIDHFKASYFQYVGKKLHAPLAAGTYVGNITLERNGKALAFTNSTKSVIVN